MLRRLSTTSAMKVSGTVDAAETAKFGRMAAQWWDPKGPVAPLHQLNPTRVAYISKCLAPKRQNECFPLQAKKILDVGCGGGLLSESLARLGANVLGVDAAPNNIVIAAAHAAQDPMLKKQLRYKHTTTSELASAGTQYDAVMALEIIEHVSNPQLFLRECVNLVKPGGSLFVSTLNRTPQSFALAIVAAEYILNWVEPGTHDWNRFVTVDELHSMLPETMLSLEARGISYNPFSATWTISNDTSVNYITHAKRQRVTQSKS